MQCCSAVGVSLSRLSFPLDVDMRAALGEQTKRTIIFEAELLALVCAMKLWVRYLAWSPVVAFVDNNSARDVAISAKARSVTAKGLVSEYLEAEYDFGVIPWVCPVQLCRQALSRTLRARFMGKENGPMRKFQGVHNGYP